MRITLLRTIARTTASLIACAFITITAAANAQAREPEMMDELFAQLPSFSGSYLAARFAGNQRDLPNAAEYYQSVLANNPDDTDILERVFIIMLADGKIEESLGYAQRLYRLDPTNRLARIVLAVSSLKRGHYKTALLRLKEQGETPTEDVTSGLLSAWAEAGLADSDAALKAIDDMRGILWSNIFKSYHAGLIADFAGKPLKASGLLYEALLKDPTAGRVAQAYARALTRADRQIEAKQFLSDKPAKNHPLVIEEFASPQTGALMRSAKEGAAEVLHGLGTILLRDGGEDLAAIYLHLATWLYPQSDVAWAALGDLFESIDEFDHANMAYGRVSKLSPLKTAATVRESLNLFEQGFVTKAIENLEQALKASPGDSGALTALGNILRVEEKYPDAIDVYTALIEKTEALGAIPESQRSPDEQAALHNIWATYYFRGIAYERLKKWDAAEADFKKAIGLNAEEAAVLNYLGYMWADQGENLTEALALIEKAIEIAPNNGYYVDSLGWVLFKQGNLQDALQHMEKAVTLTPYDPIINDHYGDVLWAAGHKREASFQWKQALTLDPEELEKQKIMDKISQFEAGEKQSGAPEALSQNNGESAERQSHSTTLQ